MVDAVTWEVVVGERRLAYAVARPDAPPRQRIEFGGEIVLSRFAWLRRERDTIVAESALSTWRVTLDSPVAVTMTGLFERPRRPDAPLAHELGLELATLHELVELLLEAAVLVTVEQATDEDAPPLGYWQFPDLLFHARTRGRTIDPVGGTYRMLERVAPEPAHPPQRWAETVALQIPDLERAQREDPSLICVQTVRSSVRHYDEVPPDLARVSEFLYRVGRIEDIWHTPVPGPAPNRLELLAKPYPSGGALYELELYPVIAACGGLEPGIYHYAAERHVLARVAPVHDLVNELLGRGAEAMGVAPGSLQILVVITARFARIAWKYESIAYELVLKHVGIMMQTMYLTATAMGLAPCALGTGDADLFARASGIGWIEEPAVGEFALGSRRTAVLAAPWP